MEQHRTFFKPEKVVKEKKQWKPGPKKERVVAEWKQGILSHHQSTPSKADRAEFPLKVVKAAIAEADGKCQCGCGLPDTETHHVMPRARNGRGVQKNAMRLNGSCNTRFHDNEAELQKWIEIYRKKYGDNFWFDEQDQEAHDKKQNEIKEIEEEKKKRLEQLEPVINLLSSASGRKLRAKEIRFLDNMGDQEMLIFANLIKDVVGVQLDKSPTPFSYGHFND